MDGWRLWSPLPGKKSWERRGFDAVGPAFPPPLAFPCIVISAFLSWLPTVVAAETATSTVQLRNSSKAGKVHAISPCHQWPKLGGTTMKGVPSLNVDFRREVFLAQATSRRTYNETSVDPFFFHSRRKGAQVGKGAQNRGRWCEALSKNLLPIRTSTVPHIQLGLCTRASRCRN